MKQHITESQWKELSQKASIRLLNWCIVKSPQSKSYYEKALTIGQMIEFLDEYCLITRQDWGIQFGKKSTIVSTSGNKNGKHQLKAEMAVELCDSLWGAVKEVLERVDNFGDK